MPATAPDLAIGDIADLARELEAQRILPMIEPTRAEAVWHAAQAQLVVALWLPVPAGCAWSTLYWHTVTLRWGQVNQYDDGWYDAGWHWVSLPRIDDIEAARIVSARINRRWAA